MRFWRIRRRCSPSARLCPPWLRASSGSRTRCGRGMRATCWWNPIKRQQPASAPVPRTPPTQSWPRFPFSPIASASKDALLTQSKTALSAPCLKPRCPTELSDMMKILFISTVHYGNHDRGSWNTWNVVRATKRLSLHLVLCLNSCMWLVIAQQ